jgi:phosphatidylserine/phosphatidylglycerophosphate/cardiolipin synthase-like enzyme
VFTRHPAQLADNPLTAGDAHPLFGLEADVAGVGIFHNKYQVVTRSAGDEVPDGTGAGGIDVVHAAHVGGIDINPNRLTTTAHQARGPMHDVHARLRGPVVSDVARTFAEFWDYARSEPSALDPDAPRVRSPAMAAEVALPVPLSPPPHVFTADEDPHLARLVRTIHRPRPGGFAMPFAPTGDDSAVRSMEAALAAAEDYIYIEDQYFTPHDGFVDLLVAAAARCRRLIVIVPAVSDQPFGGERREAVYARLRAAWGSRFLVGAPHRRPLVAAAGRATHLGRVNLLVVAEAEANRIWVGPAARVTGEPPFWLWIAGEQMLVTGVQKPVAIAVGDTILTSAQLDVVRGGAPGAPRWGAHPRRHPAGAAVTFAQPFGIYNHAKTMMIDDLFVSIGSTNINRRGFYHDGEIGVVAVPQALRGSPSNPARVLRTRLWAEHLGIPPAMGPAVLADPVAASDLFFRSRWVGNRFAPSSSVDPTPYFPVDVDLYPVTFFQILKQLIPALENTTANIAHLRVWNYLIDPTSYLQAEPDRELV